MRKPTHYLHYINYFKSFFLLTWHCNFWGGGGGGGGGMRLGGCDLQKMSVLHTYVHYPPKRCPSPKCKILYRNEV